MSQSYSMRGMWKLCLFLLLCVIEVRAEESNNNISEVLGESTHYIITLKPPIDPPTDFKPSNRLHQHASLMMKSVPNSTLLHMYDNIATYFKMYMFSIRFDKSEDLAILGDKFGKDIKSVEAVSSFYASELVTDVRNLAHGLPYRQVLNRPFRDLTEISGDTTDLRDLACTLEAAMMDNLTQEVRFGQSMGRKAQSQTASTNPDSVADRDAIKEPDAPVTVFVMDTGVQGSHEWFQAGQVTCRFDFERELSGLDDDDDDAFAARECVDTNGHGTQIAGIIGGSSPSKIADGSRSSGNSNSSSSSDIVSVRVLGSNGEGNSDDIIAGLDYVIGSYFRMKLKNPRTANAPQRHLSAIIHMSFSGRSSQGLRTLVNAVSKVMPVVGASGDDDSFSCWTTPADAKSAIIVGASMSVSNLPISGSNFGECISMVAPGQHIVAPFIGESNREEKSLSGSSASAAKVAAVLVNVMRIIDTNRHLYAAFHSQIAELDVAVFLKAVITETISQGSRNKDNSHADVHKEGFFACAVDSHDTIRLKLEERLKETVSKSFLDVVQYDENAPRFDSPMKGLKSRFENMRKKKAEAKSEA